MRTTTSVVASFGVNSTTSTTTEIYYILSDHLNTPRKVTNATGTVLWSWNSDAFGTTPANQDVDGDGTDFEFNLRFPGQYFDKESSQHYNYFRDYEPGTGRYLESDPIGLSGGINSYLYGSANPLTYLDPFGTNSTTLGGWGIRILGGATCAIPVPGARVIGLAMITSTLRSDSCSQNCDDDCERLAKEIEILIGLLKDRLTQALFDIHGLYPSSGRFSWEGHKLRYEQMQSQLRKKMNEANYKRCSYDKVGANYWANKPFPLFPSHF